MPTEVRGLENVWILQGDGFSIERAVSQQLPHLKFNNCLILLIIQFLGFKEQLLHVSLNRHKSFGIVIFFQPYPTNL